MIVSAIKKFFAPSPHIKQVPENKVSILYKAYRWNVLEASFLGYAMFYLVRNNLSTVATDIHNSLHYDFNMIGNILAISSITYGLGKFLMGSMSDRCNPRKFMAFGLLLTAICNFAFGSIENYSMHLILWGLNGFIQGMGWPPCGRTIGHWFSLRERGSIFAVWNVAHNIGGGLAGMLAGWAASNFGWRAAFYFPGIIAVIGSVYLFIRLRDTPQSVGLPPVEEYRNDYPNETSELIHEKELSTKELFIDNILKNKYLWLFACANFFVYIVRYSMLDWGPAYLNKVKGASLEGGGLAVMILEFGGIPSTLLMGWLSDRVGGRRGMISLLCMIPILFAFAGIYVNTSGLWLDLILLATVGFFVYPPVMLLGVSGLDLTSKKAVGTAAGFIGLFGYIGRTVQDKLFGFLAHKDNWDAIIISILIATVISIIMLAFTWKIKPKA